MGFPARGPVDGQYTLRLCRIQRESRGRSKPLIGRSPSEQAGRVQGTKRAGLIALAPIVESGTMPVAAVLLFANCRKIRMDLSASTGHPFTATGAWRLSSMGFPYMKIKLSWFLPAFCLGVLPISTVAQCKDPHDKHCWNLQYILYAAETDFREFRPSKPLKAGDPKIKVPNPDVSAGAAQVPCHTSIWSSAVAVYMCSAEIPVADAEEWYGKTMKELQQLQYRWEFKTAGAGTDHYVDAGPAGCEVPPLEKTYSDGSSADGPYLADGPYIGQCPLHLEAVTQADGTAKVYFWLSSYSSPYLTHKQESPSKYLPQSAKSQAPQSASTSESTSPSSAATEGAPRDASVQPSSQPAASKYASCDDLCQGLKKILDQRSTGFRERKAASAAAADSRSSDRIVKLSGASSCSINAAPSAGPRTSAKNEPLSRVHLAAASTKGNTTPPPAAPAPSAQYVCYWPEDSVTTAENQFRDLVTLLEVLIPSDWSARKQNQPDELTGAEVTLWTARDSRNRAAVGVYLSGKSVGLHVSASD
jgi:hypothetical protein